MEKSSLIRMPPESRQQNRFWQNVSDRSGISWTSFWAMGALIVLLSIPAFVRNPYYLRLIEIAALYGIAALALSLVYGKAGIVSLCHMGLFGVGAYVSAVLALKFDLPVWIAMIVAVLATCFMGWLLALSSARIIGVYLAMTTVAFNIVIERLIIQFPDLTDAAAGMINIPLLILFGHTFELESFYYLILLAVLGSIYMVHNFNHSSWNLVTNSLRETPTASLFMGNSVPRLRVLLLVVSAFMIGVAGTLFTHMMGRLNYNNFTWDQSVVLLAMVVLGGKRELWGPLAGAAILIYVPFAFGTLVEYMNIVYALILLFFLLVAPTGLMGWVRKMWIENSKGPSREARVWKLATPVYSVAHARSVDKRPVIEVMNVSKRFGGLTALRNVSLGIKPGEIHALIGPNGAGKTTLVNVMTGLYPPEEGDVRIQGASIANKSADEIVLMGVGRTFQQPSLVIEMTTAENMQVATHHRLRANIVSTLLGLPSHHRLRKASRSEALDLLQAVGLADIADVPIGQIPYGYQRLVEIARALGVHPKILVLDEPAAGLAPEEMEHLQHLLQVIRSNDIAILIIEHNMEFVMSIADQISVLNFGAKIAEGPPVEIQADEAVLAAYLGE